MSTNSAPDRKRRYLLLATAGVMGGTVLGCRPTSGPAPITDFEPPHEEHMSWPCGRGRGRRRRNVDRIGQRAHLRIG